MNKWTGPHSLVERQTIHPLRASRSSHLSQGDRVNGKLFPTHYYSLIVKRSSAHHSPLTAHCVADCPPETGWTRSKATEGVDKNCSPLICLSKHFSTILFGRLWVGYCLLDVEDGLLAVGHWLLSGWRVGAVIS